MILAMDRSGSMTATDISPDRMTAAREAAVVVRRGPARRLQGRRRVLLGQGRRGRAADGRPRRGGRRALSSIQAENGTAIGDAITRSLDLGLSSLDEDKKTADGKVTKDADGQSPLVILLLSDGASTTGDYTPLAGGAAREGRRRAGLHRRARHRRTARSRAPTATAASARSASRRIPRRSRQVAEDDRRPFFEAADADALKSVYDEIGSQVGVEHKTRELTVVFTAVGRRAAPRRRRALDALVRPPALTGPAASSRPGTDAAAP